MTIIMMIMAAFLALAGLVCVWAWLICLGRGAERLAARPAAIFAVVLFALAITAAGAALAQTAPHHHEFHRDFYRHWMQPGTGVSCCDARVTRDGQEVGDCEPTRAEIRAGAWWAWLRQESRWIEIPDARIIRERSPNVTDAHICWNYGQVLCFVPPATGG